MDRVVLPWTAPCVAVITVLPEVETALENPSELIVATPLLEELHVTEAVISWVLLFVYVPVAVNCLVAPS